MMAPDAGNRYLGALRLIASPANDSRPQGRPPLDDRALLARVRAGHAQVAADLCDRLSPQVTRTIVRLLGRRDADADDLSQIALMEIVNHIDRYRGDCSLDRWAQTVTSHVVFKHLRRRTLERRLFSQLLVEDGHAGPQHIERMSVSRDLLARIAGHLDSMNETRAWAFLLHDVMGYDLQEMAQMLRISASAAQSRLSRGRRELHRQVEADVELADLVQQVAENLEGSGEGEQP